MKLTYSAAADALAMELAPDATSARTVHQGPDVALDFDAAGRLITVEILNASAYYPAAVLEQLATPVAWLSLAEAAREGGFASPAVLRVLIHQDRIPAEKRGRDWVIARHELANYLENKDPRGRHRGIARPTRRKRQARSVK